MPGRRKRPLSEAERKKKRAKINRTYWKKHKDRINKSRRDRAASDPEYRERRNLQGRGEPKRWLQRTYGISRAEYEAMAAAQDGRCLICEEQPRRGLCVDHCHKRKVVRGLLCNNCNVGLGYFNDDPVRLLRAAAYLLGFEAKVGASIARRKVVSSALRTIGKLVAQLSPPRRRQPTTQGKSCCSKNRGTGAPRGRLSRCRVNPEAAVMPQKHSAARRIGGPGASHENRKRPRKSKPHGEVSRQDVQAGNAQKRNRTSACRR